eukprot:scaffold6389_cov75-Phaeocystis_antarctica.AAC.4
MAVRYRVPAMPCSPQVAQVRQLVGCESTRAASALCSLAMALDHPLNDCGCNRAFAAPGKGERGRAGHPGTV